MQLLAPDLVGIKMAANALLEGDLVAFPTETVYGLGALATSDRAVGRVFAAKQRPASNPLIAHVADRNAAAVFAQFDPRAAKLAEAFWPGPLTLVLPLKLHTAVSRLVTPGLGTIAVRVPSHPAAQALLRAVELPVAAPSANRSGSISATCADHVVSSLGENVDYIVEGGPCAMGLESTVVDLSDDAQPAMLLRPGSIPTDDIERLVGVVARPDDRTPIRSPGMLARHYAPATPLRIDASDVRPQEALLAFGRAPLETGGPMLNLSERGDVGEAAANLYGMMRALDAENVSAIAVMPIPVEGLGEAINDRLRRASVPMPEADAA